LDTEFDSWYSLRDIFPVNNVGFVTGRDDFAIDIDEKALEARITNFRDPNISDGEIISKYGLHDTTSWKLNAARDAIRNDKKWSRHYAKCLYRPFDERWIFFSDDLLERPVWVASKPLLSKDNWALVSMRQVVQDDMGYSHFTVTTHPVDNRCFKSNKGIVQVYPLFVPNPKSPTELMANVGEDFREHLCKAVGIEWSSKSENGKIGPLMILQYVTAITFSNNYRTKYSQQLRVQDPRIPIYASAECFIRLTMLGHRIIEALTLNNLGPLRTTFPVSGTDKVETKYPTYDKDTKRVYINDSQFFEGIEELVWEYQLGGHFVCLDWLKDRRGRSLTYAEKVIYQNMISAIYILLHVSDMVDELLSKFEGKLFHPKQATGLLIQRPLPK
jgi:predicted helicase